ncbi:hypothetical protein GCM10020331_022540 [Ectobacillus funiculus]
MKKRGTGGKSSLLLPCKNLQHTLRALHYNIAQEIWLYRLSSSIVPLATHPEVEFDYIDLFRDMWKEIGQLIQKASPAR